MTGSEDLQFLLDNMQPVLSKEEFVFCSVSTQDSIECNALMSFQENEGLTLVLRRNEADKLEMAYDGVWALITLNVHSSLTAVGFLAVVTKALASHGISCNAVSAYFHDHLLVPFGRGEEAKKLLEALSE